MSALMLKSWIHSIGAIDMGYKKIPIDSYAIGTTTVMEYVDEHPEEKLDHTTFYNPEHPQIGVIASDVSEELLLPYEDREWWPVLDGWERLTVFLGWICRKNNRYIFIST